MFFKGLTSSALSTLWWVDLDWLPVPTEPFCHYPLIKSTGQNNVTKSSWVETGISITVIVKTIPAWGN